MSDTVIALREDCILAAEGKSGAKPKITDARRIDVEGYGDPLEQWKQALIKYKQECRPDKVKLILPTTYSSARITQVPYAGGRELTKMAANVMQEAVGDGIADYGIVQSDKKKGISVCTAAAEADTLEEILGICKETGLNVEAVTVPMEGYLKGLSAIKAYEKVTAVFLLFEDSSVTSVLYQNGVYMYSTRSRIFSERGTLDFGTEIARNISGILQFYSTRKADTPITGVYYAGCAQDDFEVCVPGIRNMNLEVHPMKTGFQFETDGAAEDWLVCMGALITDKKKQINLCQAFKQSQNGQKAEKGSTGKQLVIPGVTLLICLALIAGVNVWNMSTKRQIKEIDTWINDSANKKAYKAAEKVRKKGDQLIEAQSQVNRMKSNLATYPVLTEEMTATIVNSGGSQIQVEIESMDAETGLLTFHAVSPTVIDIPGYISRLTDTGLFSSVDYSGYQFGDGEYSLDLSCILKAQEDGGDK